MTTLRPEGPILLRQGEVWPTWRKIAFRFAFIYIVLYTTPWALPTSAIPWLANITNFYDAGWDWIVRLFNTHFFHVRPELVPLNGSGDTSFGWAQLWFMLSFGLIAAGIWSAIDRKRKNYEILDYWLRIGVRYVLSFYCLLYGIIKVFALQMVFPNLSQLATPLGDFLPMRFSWLFIGYSTPYQMFSGVMECIAGLLLINRKTVTLGLITATGVFIHVFVLNMAYDIPVKLFSFHLLVFCIYLLSYELKRLINFFILNRVSDPDTFFNVEFRTAWMRNARIIAKLAFIILALIVPLYNTYLNAHKFYSRTEVKPIRTGVYDVDLFVLNKKDTLPALVTDSVRWKEMIFDVGGAGSVKTTDTLFRQRYGRGYFNYEPDTTSNTIAFRGNGTGDQPALTMKFRLPNDKTIELWSKYKNDSLYVRLVRTNRHFQLAEKQFHWLTEYNR